MCSTGWEQAITGAQASKSASEAQQSMNAAAIQEQNSEYQNNINLQRPWLNAGANALTQQTAMAGNLPDLSTGAYQASDYNKWVTQQGVNALSASGAAAGNYGSGNLGTALTQYGQNQAGSQYQQWYSNTLGEYLTKYNQYAGLSGTGQVTAQNLGQAGQTTANNISSLLQNTGAAQSQAALQTGQGISNAFTTSGNQGMSALGQYLQYNQNQQLANLLKGNTYGSDLSGGTNYYNQTGAGNYQLGSAGQSTNWLNETL
jgi:hypothetical protein